MNERSSGWLWVVIGIVVASQLVVAWWNGGF